MEKEQYGVRPGRLTGREEARKSQTLLFRRFFQLLGLVRISDFGLPSAFGFRFVLLKLHPKWLQFSGCSLAECPAVRLSDAWTKELAGRSMDGMNHVLSLRSLLCARLDFHPPPPFGGVTACNAHVTALLRLAH
jgi:hypothetical protein